MAVSAGARFGPYEILDPLGAGGMGQVYRARDTRLDRLVAFKIISPDVAQSAGRRHRFQREARAIASLSHPHICSLYDVGEHETVAFLVMEYLQGETLAQRLVRGPLPAAELLRHATEIAMALDHAHRHGVIHRDLKPSNVMLTSAGAKLLDFGLAKLPAGASAIMSSTLSVPGAAATAEGSILGTFQYMSPEQLEGQEADARTDIFAFGALAYEMATGRRAFEGASQASVIAAILRGTPPRLTTLAPLTPPAFDHIVTRCLAKDPDERWQTARDLMLEVRAISSGDMAAAPRRRRVHLSRELVAWTLTAAAVFAAALLARTYWRPPPALISPPPSLTRSALVLPAGAPVAVEDQPSLALSADGRRLVYTAKVGSGTQLYLRPLDQPRATPIAGTEGASSPFFSPDGEWVGFFADGKLKKILLDGGVPVTIADAPRPRGATWAPDGSIIFTPGVNTGLFRVSAAGGAVQALTTTDSSKAQISHRWPEVLPDGESVLLTVWGGRTEEARIAVLHLRTGRLHILPIEGASSPHFVQPGNLVYRRASSLFAVPFDAATFEVTNVPTPVADGIAVHQLSAVHATVSRTGVLVYVSADDAPGELALQWVDRQGRDSPSAISARALEEPRISPDGTRLVVTVRENNADVWVFDLITGARTRLTVEADEDETPVWGPAADRITFSAARRGLRRCVFYKRADGAGTEQLLWRVEKNDDHLHADGWSANGRTLALTNLLTSSEGSDIWTLTPDDNPRFRPFLVTPFNEGGARFASDGRSIAYVSDESGRNEVYVRPFPGPGPAVQISTDGGSEPVWARSGDELFYRNGDKMIAASIRLLPETQVRNRQVLFEAPYVHGRRQPANFDVSPDGRFIMVKDVGQPVARLNLVLGALTPLPPAVR